MRYYGVLQEFPVQPEFMSCVKHLPRLALAIRAREAAALNRALHFSEH